MHRFFTVAISLLFLFSVSGQPSTSGTPGETLQRPKLVVGIMVDQMRWDFLYRYYDRFAAGGGFKRMLNQGFSCENTIIPFAPTVTAPGHSTAYTGTVPAIHGITGNLWWDRSLRRNVYCTEDKTVQTVGSGSQLGLQSPRNMLVTTICDELRLATNFQSKVIGVAIKDRGAILPAGHSANGAYWYDNTNGNWISSTYYMTDLPQWVKDFNARKLVDKYYQQGWNTLYANNTYTQSTTDDKPYESKGLGAGFPYDLKKFIGKNYGAIASTPHGNSLTFDVAKAALDGEKLGADAITDFLAVSISSPDYIGHSFGPNSIEQEDDFLRLDKDLGDFFTFLDSKVGAGQYMVFLSADHGVAHIPGFMKENKLPGGSFSAGSMAAQLNQQLKDKYGKEDLVVSDFNYQFTLNDSLINSAKLNKDEISAFIIDFLTKQPPVARAFEINKMMETPLNNTIREMLVNGYYPLRGGDIQVILHSNWIESYGSGGTTHGAWAPYDSHIPLLWYGWGIKAGKTNRETYMTDIAPTIAAMLHIQMPSGNIGKVITEIAK